jgi:hypothetical protein
LALLVRVELRFLALREHLVFVEVAGVILYLVQLLQTEAGAGRQVKILA